MGTLRRRSEAQAERRLTNAAALPTKLQLPITASVFSCRLTAPPSCTAARKLATSQLQTGARGERRTPSKALLASKAQPLIATRPVFSSISVAPPSPCA